MAWIRLDDGFADHPKLAACRNYEKALATYIQLLCYASRQLTDGRLPELIVKKSNGSAVKELVRVGLLDQDGSDLIIHDYLTYNPSRERVIRDRSESAARMRRSRGDVAGDVAPQHVAKFGRSSGEVPPSPTPTPTPRTRAGSSDREVVDESTSSSACSVPRDCRSTSSIQSEVLGYWTGKTGRDPSDAEARSLRSLCRRFPAGVVCLAIGQAVVQGEPADNFALITTIAKAEAAKQ